MRTAPIAVGRATSVIPFILLASFVANLTARINPLAILGGVPYTNPFAVAINRFLIASSDVTLLCTMVASVRLRFSALRNPNV